MTARPKQSSPAVKSGVYTRISSDPSGERAGVDRQRADCEAHCKARGWEVVEVFCD
ncbi:MAG: recombinase family protein, partial [Actinomycetota bacterium]|nr:recombinase family protein [Actinomycetota bacterium]